MEDDRKKLDDAYNKVKNYVNQRVTHRDKRDVASVVGSDFENVINTIVGMFNKYYLLINNSQIELNPVIYPEWKKIFQKPWNPI